MREVKTFLGWKQMMKAVVIASVFLVITAIEIAIASIIKTTIDIKNDNIYQFLDYIPVLLVLSVLFGLGKFCTTKTCTGFGAGIIKNKKNKLVNHIQKLPVSSLKSHDGEFYTVLHENMFLVEEFLVLLPGTLAAPLILIMTLTIMFMFSWKLTLVCLISIPVPMILFGIINRPIERKTSENLTNVGKVNDYLKCMLEGIDIIKTYHLFSTFSHKFHGLLTNVEKKNIEIEKTKAMTTPMSFVLRVFPQCVIPLYSAYLALNGENTIGLLPAFSLLIGNIFIPIESILSFSTKFRETMAVIHKVKSLEQITEERDGGKLPAVDAMPLIEFEHVFFAYTDVNVLEDISFRIMPKRLVAIVGESGSGKSTITKLICGLYENYEGSVKIFDTELRTLDLEKLREQNGVMSQTPFILPGTIRENMLYGVGNCTEAEVADAMQMANLQEVIDKLAEGEQTILKERGMNLSKGQRQRIAMARVILRKSPLIILDEATSGLDPLSVASIQKALMELKTNDTVLMVTHDINLASQADEIILVHKNRIIQTGTHEQLMQEPIYHSMYLVQNRGEQV